MTADLSPPPEALRLALCQTHLTYVLNLSVSAQALPLSGPRQPSWRGLCLLDTGA
jgi:hypothetical protein